MSRTIVDFMRIAYLGAFLFTAVCEAEYFVTPNERRIKIDSFDGSITTIQGILVGHTSKSERPTGCTVILCNTTCVGGVDVRGSAPGTRETDLLDPINLVDTVNAIVLSGGSAFGLDTASGVVRCLAERNMGFLTESRPVPIVPAAVLYDLSVGHDPSIVPDANLGYSACMAANNSRVIEGNVGAGTGATIGKLFGMERAMKTGLGSTSLTVRDLITNATVTVGALVALNAVGDVYKNGALIAGARTSDGKRLLNTLNTVLGISPTVASTFPVGTATTLACVTTDAKLTKAQAKKVSQMAHDGFARAINPIHTMFDGDIVFTLATGLSSISDVNLIGIMAAETVERAIIRAVEQATGLPDLPSIHELGSTGDKLIFNFVILAYPLFSKFI
ncbi:unnamed protein product [Rotaria sp. Silwood1]|nr:unnamed protein product [Rotaria sp. Silwood1]